METTNTQFFTAEQIEELTKQHLAHFGALKDLQQIPEEEMEAYYSVAYNLYNAGKYEKAEKIFQFLCLYDHWQYKYWLGLGGCRQNLKDYAGAIDAYSMANLMNANDPTGPFHAADCHIASGNREKAISALQAAIHFSGEKEAYQIMKNRAEAMLALLQKK